CKLFDAGYIGSYFTISCGKVSSRLDRVLCDAQCLKRFPSLSVKHLPRTVSGHSPLFVNIKCLTSPPMCSFKFQNMLLNHCGLREVVENCWQDSVYGEPMYVLCAKLKALKLVLRRWNKEVFGNVISLVDNAEEEVSICENTLATLYTELHRRTLKLANDNLIKCLAIEEDLLSQRSGIKWLKEGDKSTYYFHDVIKKKHRRSNIAGIMVDGDWITDSIGCHICCPTLSGCIL
ncbi:hypothetical protein Leryth_026920, partial [Lithospermum erythrorhizon]